MAISFINKINGQRLDQCLVKQSPQLGRRAVRNMCLRGSVFVNDKPMRPGNILRDGDVITCVEPLIPVMAREHIAGNSLELSVVYEDAHLLVVDKPRCMHSVTHNNSDEVTLADCVCAQYKECKYASSDLKEAGLVQRLDYFTSGLVLVAKSSHIWKQLHKMLQEEQIHKSYTAFVQGDFPSETLSLNYLLEMPKNKNKVNVIHSSERLGLDNFVATHSEARKCAKLNVLCSLVEVRVARGRRHQVRAHLSACGYPLVGDFLYGATSSLLDFSSLLKASEDIRFDGFLLHAQSISFHHPETKKFLELESKSEIFENLQLEGLRYTVSQK